MSFDDVIEHHARNFPEKIAISFGGEHISWKSLHEKTGAIASRIRNGMHSGRVAILARNSPSYVEVIFGALKAGYSIVPLSPMASPETIRKMIALCEPDYIFAGSEQIDTLSTNDLLLGAGCSTTVSLDSPREGWPIFDDLLHADSNRSISGKGENKEFAIVFSSGTTGNPKGVVQTYDARWKEATSSGFFSIASKSVVLISTPIYSNTTISIILKTIVGGGRMIIMKKFNEREFIKICEEESVTHTVLVPVQFRRILDCEDFAPARLKSLNFTTSTSAPLDMATKLEIRQKWPGTIAEVYGMTEGGIFSVLDISARPDKLQSVGVPPPGVDVRIIGDEEEELPVGSVGEIVGTGSSAMAGYLGHHPDADQRIWRAPDGKRLLRTGDLGMIDDDGFLTILGRKKEMIISGGFNIYPADLEEMLLQHPAVTDAAVIGRPSRHWGETPAAVVTLGVDEAPTAEELREWANARLGKGQQLSEVRFIAELPRNELGKILKFQLQTLFDETPQ